MSGGSTESLGAALREGRRSRRLSATELVDRVHGLTHESLQSLEDGVSRPPLAVLTAVVRALGFKQNASRKLIRDVQQLVPLKSVGPDGARLPSLWDWQSDTTLAAAFGPFRLAGFVSERTLGAIDRATGRGDKATVGDLLRLSISDLLETKEFGEQAAAELQQVCEVSGVRLRRQTSTALWPDYPMQLQDHEDRLSYLAHGWDLAGNAASRARGASEAVVPTEQDIRAHPFLDTGPTGPTASLQERFAGVGSLIDGHLAETMNWRQRHRDVEATMPPEDVITLQLMTLVHSLSDLMENAEASLPGSAKGFAAPKAVMQMYDSHEQPLASSDELLASGDGRLLEFSRRLGPERCRVMLGQRLPKLEVPELGPDLSQAELVESAVTIENAIGTARRHASTALANMGMQYINKTGGPGQAGHRAVASNELGTALNRAAETVSRALDLVQECRDVNIGEQVDALAVRDRPMPEANTMMRHARLGWATRTAAGAEGIGSDRAPEMEVVGERIRATAAALEAVTTFDPAPGPVARNERSPLAPREQPQLQAGGPPHSAPINDRSATSASVERADEPARSTETDGPDDHYRRKGPEARSSPLGPLPLSPTRLAPEGNDLTGPLGMPPLSEAPFPRGGQSDLTGSVPQTAESPDLESTVSPPRCSLHEDPSKQLGLN